MAGAQRGDGGSRPGLAALLFGWAWIALLPLALLVAWARVELGERTPWEVLVGAFVGAISTSMAYVLVP